ncbi:hypothetical protein R1flu_001512 [Riccia fluitans]|uniref:AP2/ERF domain-containing protein n=1 Tax=Riccia fluitans TaxID=41844 RepID=A0ABD1Y6G8_9MARC
MGTHYDEASDASDLNVPSKGVRKRGDKWVAEIRSRRLRRGQHPARKWLGTFDSAAKATEAYLRAEKKIRPSVSNSRPVTVRRGAIASSQRLFPKYSAHPEEKRLFVEPIPKWYRKTGVCVGRSSGRSKRRPVFRDRLNSAKENFQEEAKLTQGDAPDTERKRTKIRVIMKSSAISSSSDSDVSSGSGTSVILEDSYDSSSDLQPGSSSTAKEEISSLDFNGSCSLASPSSFPTESSGEQNQGGESADGACQNDPMTAQNFVMATDHVSKPLNSLAGYSLFSYRASVILDENGAQFVPGINCDSAELEVLVSTLCPCSVMFINNQRHCPSSECLWNHRNACPLVTKNQEGDVESSASEAMRSVNQRGDHILDDMRIRTQNFTALKIKQLISELEAELILDAGFPVHSQQAAETAGVSKANTPETESANLFADSIITSCYGSSACD